MYYTCKTCCTLFKEYKKCPVCQKMDHVHPITIHLDSKVKVVKEK